MAAMSVDNRRSIAYDPSTPQLVGWMCDLIIVASSFRSLWDFSDSLILLRDPRTSSIASDNFCPNDLYRDSISSTSPSGRSWKGDSPEAGSILIFSTNAEGLRIKA